jgi:hypothetical protein
MDNTKGENMRRQQRRRSILVEIHRTNRSCRRIKVCIHVFIRFERVNRDLLRGYQVFNLLSNVGGGSEKLTCRNRDLGIESLVGKVGGLNGRLYRSLISVLRIIHRLRR